MGLKNNYNYVLFSLLLFFLPISFNYVSYVIGIWLITFGLNHQKYRLKEYFNRKNRIYILFNLFFLIDILGMLYSQNWGQGLSKISRDISFLVLPLLFYFTLKDKSRIEKIMFGYVFFLLILCLICYFKAVWDAGVLYPVSSNLPFYYDSPFGRNGYLKIIGGIHPSYFSWFLFFGVIYIIDRFKSKERKLRIFLCFVGLFFFFTVIILGSKIFLALFSMLSLSIMARLFLTNGSLITKVLSVIVLLTMTQLVIFNQQIRYRIQNELGNSILFKKEQWSASANIITENIFLGVGTGDFNNQINIQYEKMNSKIVTQNLNSHNQFLQTFATFGITGFLLLCSTFVFMALKIGFKRKAYLVFVFATSIFFLFESVLVRSRGLIFLIITFLVIDKICSNHNK